jgi:nucleotide-binding universal stress UspA family protein
VTIRKILVPLSGQYDPADPETLEGPALETAFIVARRLNAHVEVFCIEAEPSEAHRRLVPWMPRLAVEEFLGMIEDESEKRRERARALFESVATRFSASRTLNPDPEVGFSVNMLEQVGDIGGSLSIRGRLADLIVTACPPLDRSGGVPPLLETSLRETGRPVLISRQAASDTFGEKVAVAWNGSAEAASAVGLAMDFLTRAREVVLISVTEDGAFQPSGESLSAYLGWHGVHPQCVTIDGSAHSAGRLILQQVEESGADMLIMGAYTRNRVRRVIFGGVTGDVLDRMPVPVFMVD